MVKECKCKTCECRDREVFEESFEFEAPYSEIQNDDNLFIRKFSKDIKPHLLKWHFDNEDRLITAIETNDWLFQFDNNLPQKIDKSIYIAKGLIHRIIKGTTDLLIKIEKNADNSTGI